MSDAKRIRSGEKVRLANGLLGEVLMFWPKDVRPHADWMRQIEEGRRMFDCTASAFDRYLVKVVLASKRGAQRKPQFFAPLAGVLERLNPRALRS